MDIEEEERIEAVNRYIREDKPSNICRDADRLEKWYLLKKRWALEMHFGK